MPHGINVSLGKLIFWLVALVVVLFGLIALSAHFAMQSGGNAPSAVTQAETSTRTPPPRPDPTQSDMIAAQTQSFQLLVSYVDTGFEPQTATIHPGDTVRFANNSSGELWVAASGGKLYPSVQNGCGSSALDSCGPIDLGRYWQFTFTQKGTWEFVNNLDKTMSGTIEVK
jgi:plastocyanin